MKDKKKVLKISIISALAVIVLAVVIIVAGVGNYLADYAIGRGGDGGNRQVSLEVDSAEDTTLSVIDQAILDQIERSEDFLKKCPGEEVSITNENNLKLQGVYYAAQSADSHLWAIGIHGYRGNHTGATRLAQHYYDAGYHVITPDLRACGESEGNYVGMGWLDRKDILEWIDWIIAKDADAEIVVHGISMGAATTMMVSGEDTPDQVKVFVEDCGYTSVWDIFASELKLRFGLPTFPVLNSASVIASIKAGYGFEEASSLEQVKKCEKPMLFIHGDLDDFVPYDMMQPLYDAKPGTNKESYTANGAGHGEAMYVDDTAYWETVFEFIEEQK